MSEWFTIITYRAGDKYKHILQNSVIVRPLYQYTPTIFFNVLVGKDNLLVLQPFQSKVSLLRNAKILKKLLRICVLT